LAAALTRRAASSTRLEELEARWRTGQAERRAERTALQRKKRAAHEAVRVALREGLLQRAPCEVCGTTEDMCAHHDDYDKPLDVRWFCREHHSELHGWTAERVKYEDESRALMRTIDELIAAGEDRFGSERVMDLHRQLRQLDLRRRGLTAVPFTREAETRLKKAGVPYSICETAEGEVIEHPILEAGG
jgi:hypothetical protein